MHVLPQYMVISLRSRTIFNLYLYNLSPTVHILHGNHSINTNQTESNVNDMDVGESNGKIHEKLTSKQFKFNIFWKYFYLMKEFVQYKLLVTFSIIFSFVFLVSSQMMWHFK